jgi:hypothetical protein
MAHPEIQQKVQAELDAVVGQSRLPHAGDRPLLPYADAAWKESARWIITAPLGVPHLNGQEDVYQGMTIPKNSRILLNFKSVGEYWAERWLTISVVLCSRTLESSTLQRYTNRKGGSSPIILKLTPYLIFKQYLDLVPGMRQPIRESIWADMLISISCTLTHRHCLSIHKAFALVVISPKELALLLGWVFLQPTILCPYREQAFLLGQGSSLRIPLLGESRQS